MAKQRNLWQEPTSSLENQEILKSFRLLFESCFGPKGGVKMLVSGGGILTVTSTSSQIIKTLPFNHPIINLILNFIKSQHCIHQDYGLYVGIISSYLIEQAWTSDKFSAKKTLKFVCDRCLALLELGSIEARMTSVSHLLAVTETILCSKPSCGLSSFDRRHLGVQLVKGFLTSVGSEAESDGLGRVVVAAQSGPSTQDTKLLEGLLYPYPEAEPLTLQLCDNKGPWRVLLYTCMLTDLPLAAKEADHLGISSSLRHFNPIVSHFSSLVPHLLATGVHLLACQKVVHPEIQVCLRRAGLVVLPRLGTELAQGLQRLSGAQPMDTPTSVWRECVGSLDSVTPTWQHGKLYLQLSKQGADVSTLLLCSPQPQAANETEVVVRQALGGLAQLMVQPRLVPGAGCLESWLAWRLREDVRLALHTAPSS